MMLTRNFETSYDDGSIKEYIGITSNEFKDRYMNHQKSFDNAIYEKEMEILKYIMDNLHVRRTFNLGKTNKRFYYKHPKIITIAKFGDEML